MQKDCNSIIRLCFRAEIKKKYVQQVQKLYRTSSFALACYNQPGNVNHELLETIIANAKKMAPLLTSLVLSVRPISESAMTSHLVSMKLLLKGYVKEKETDHGRCSENDYFAFKL